MSLCSRCSSFDVQVFTEEGFQARGYPLLAVIRAAETERCSFCSLLVNQINHVADLSPYLSYEFQNHGAEQLSFLSLFRHRISTIFRRLPLMALPQWVHFSVERGAGYRDMNDNSLNITAIIAGVGYVPTPQEDIGSIFDLNFLDHTAKIRLHVAADQGTPARQSGDIVGNLLLDRSTWSQSHYQTIQDWHHDCQLNHEECNRSISGHERIYPEDVLLPTRCVEFEFLDKQNPWTSSIQWALRETKGQRGKYIALSHRWVQDTGEASTTTDNYEDRNDTWNRAQGYHLLVRGKLSALFLDIGRLACHLGIRYVWIDSLCIIQDDKDDWNRESTKMADYYQRSWLTVAVTCPSDTGGIFQQNVSKIPRITRLPYQDKKGDQNGHFYVQAGTDKIWAEDYNKTIINSDLRKRAWVFQEWRLSRRILALSNEGMFLHCQTESPRSLDGYKVDASENIEIKSDFVRWLRNLDNDSSGFQILTSWEFVVEEYSGLELTKFEEDRLVALAGIAREYGRALVRNAAKYGKQQHTYICGLWTGWFRGLLWEQADPYRQTRTKGFPTWSWLSIASVQETETTGMTEATLTGLCVRWPLVEAAKESVVCKFLSPILVPVTNDWRPRLERAGEHELNNLFNDIHSGLFSDVHNDLHGKIYGNDIRFAILPLEGRMLDVCLDRYFESLEDADIAATMTGHTYSRRVPHEYMTMAERGRDSGRWSWRKVCLKSSCNTIIGWGSIEHPDYQDDQPIQSTTPIYAFVVCKLSEVPGGFGLGHLSGLHKVLEVLYIRRVEIVGQSDCYERIGVGRLFGDDVLQEFESSSETKVDLV